MKNATKDEAKGKFHEVKGAVKEKVGRATHNPALEDEGRDEKTAGKVQRKSARLRRCLTNTSTNISREEDFLRPYGGETDILSCVAAYHRRRELAWKLVRKSYRNRSSVPFL